MSYRYAVHAGDPESRVSSFSIPSHYGELRATITYTPAGIASTWSVWVPGTTPTVTGSISPATDPSQQVWTFSFGSLGSMFYTITPSSHTVAAMGSTVTDCDAMANSAVFKAVAEATHIIGLDVKLKASVPAQEATVFTFLSAQWVLPRLVADCQSQLLRPMFCQLMPDFDSCNQCCEQNAIMTTACKVGVTICLPIAETPWCIGIAAGCEWLGPGAEQLEIGWCKTLSCTGKPGDPGCTNPPLCAEAGGICEGACTGRSLCGACNSQMTPNCCGD